MLYIIHYSSNGLTNYCGELIRTKVGLAARDKPAAVRDVDAQVLVRIDRSVVDANFVVEVRTGRAAALADIADHVAAIHSLSSCDRIAGKVAVPGADAIAVVDDDGLAVAAHHLGDRHDAIRRGNNPGAVAAADIHAAMECAFPVERVNALAEAAGDLAFDGPQVGSRVRPNPVGGSGIPRQPHGQTDHRRAAER